MSSMRNAVQRRNHKERSQPQERSKWGLLEKHKDYSLRAADHNAKRRKIKALQQKASERNEDEFYFGMMSSETVAGVKRAKRGAENGGGGVNGLGMSAGVVKLMKTQDAGYLRTVLQSTQKKRKRVEEEVGAAEAGLHGANSGSKRVKFGEDGETEVVGGVPRADDMDGDLAGLDSDDGVDALEDESEDDAEGLTEEEIAARKSKREALAAKRRKANGLRVREEQLAIALRAVEEQRARMNGTVGGVNKHGVRFKRRQRKR